MRDRLIGTFGDDWWERGIEHAVTEDHLNNLRIEINKNPDRERHLMLDAPHFGWIITKHYNQVFGDAFTDTVRVFKDFRRLASLRNDWAHVQDISMAQARQAAELMRVILASLRCEEALEVEGMVQDLVLQPGNEEDEKSIEDLGDGFESLDSPELAVAPWDFWHQLQACLVMEKSVVLPEEDSPDQAKVIVKIHNTAPESKDRPSVHFRSVSVYPSQGRQRDLGEMAPGETKEAVFDFNMKQLIGIEFTVYGDLDSAKLFQFSRRSTLPEDVIAPLMKEFVERLEAVGVKELVNDVLNAIGSPDPNMTLADITRIREALNLQYTNIAENNKALQQLYKDFRLDKNSTLGARTEEIIRALVHFGKKLEALDEAISQTDLALMNEAVSELKQIQLAVIRVEDTIKAMTTTD